MAKLKEKSVRLNKLLKELEDMQSQLIQAEKMASLGNLAIGIAHEINNPVGAISSAANTSRRSIEKVIQFLEESRDLEEMKKDQKFRRALDVLKNNNDIIAMASGRITEITRSLRRFARPEEKEFQEADIHEELESTLILLHHELKDRIEVIKEFGDIPKIDCYPNQLNQVFVNILANSLQAIDDKGCIKIKTSKINDEIMIEISDNGRGIREEDLKNIFDPGFTTKRVGAGTGIGLSISHSIIENHKGEIKVKSELNKGTVFTIVLPEKQEEHST